MKAGIALVSALLGSACGAGQHEPDSPPDIAQAAPIPGEPPVLSDARSQLEWAVRCKLAMHGERGAHLERARRLAVEAYRAVRLRHPDARALGAEAAFRAGELLRAGGQYEEALLEFRVAHERGHGTVYRARARLESGHVQRRRGRLSEALEHYELLIADVGDMGAERRERELAAFWSACTRCDQGFEADAQRIWLRLTESARDPLTRIRAYDSAITLALRGGRLAEAWMHWRECRTQLAGTSEEATELGERVRHALQNSGCTRVLRTSLGKRALVWPRVVNASSRSCDAAVAR